MTETGVNQKSGLDSWLSSCKAVETHHNSKKVQRRGSNYSNNSNNSSGGHTTGIGSYDSEYGNSFEVKKQSKCKSATLEKAQSALTRAFQTQNQKQQSSELESDPKVALGLNVRNLEKNVSQRFGATCSSSYATSNLSSSSVFSSDFEQFIEFDIDDVECNSEMVPSSLSTSIPTNTNTNESSMFVKGNRNVVCGLQLNVNSTSDLYLKPRCLEQDIYHIEPYVEIGEKMITSTSMIFQMDDMDD